jgi:hypothetical protein
MCGALDATVPATLTFFVVAPVLAWVMLPDTDPTGALDLMRTLIWVPSEPSIAGVRVRLEENVVPSKLISKFAGAVTVTAEVRLLPLTP